MILRHGTTSLEVRPDGTTSVDAPDALDIDALLWLCAIAGPTALGHARRATGPVTPEQGASAHALAMPARAARHAHRLALVPDDD